MMDIDSEMMDSYDKPPYPIYYGEPIEHVKKRYEYKMKTAKPKLDDSSVDVMFICQDYNCGLISKKELKYYKKLLRKRVNFIDRNRLNLFFKQYIKK